MIPKDPVQWMSKASTMMDSLCKQPVSEEFGAVHLICMGRLFLWFKRLGLAALLSLVLGLGSACSRSAAPSDQQGDGRDPFFGTWRRMDGEYVLRVAGSTNGVQAEYFNPRPIHVSRVELRLVDTERELIVELRDTGYPGSTYTLRHNAASGTLEGVYFHAGLQQTFKVAFLREQAP